MKSRTHALLAHPAGEQKPEVELREISIMRRPVFGPWVKMPFASGAHSASQFFGRRFGGKGSKYFWSSVFKMALNVLDFSSHSSTSSGTDSFWANRQRAPLNSPAQLGFLGLGAGLGLGVALGWGRGLKTSCATPGSSSSSPSACISPSSSSSRSGSNGPISKACGSFMACLLDSARRLSHRGGGNAALRHCRWPRAPGRRRRGCAAP